MKLLRPLVRTLILTALLAGIAGAAQPVSAASQVRLYTATIQPTSTPAGSTYNASVTITNSTLSTQPLGSASVATPAGFTLMSAGPVTPPAGKSWSVSSASGVIQLRAVHSSDSLVAGEAVSVQLSAVASCAIGTSTWVTAATTFGGQAFQLAPGASDPTTTVTAGGGSVVDHFDVTLPSSPFTATAGESFTATITARDVCGNIATSYSGTATLSGTLGNAPNGATPTYGAVSAFSSGSATASVTAVKAETGQTLTATAGSITGTSDPFDVQPGPPASLVFTQQPSLTKVGVAISPAVQVTLYDQFENLATTASDNVSLTLSHDPADPTAGNGTLGGDASKAPVGGVATFDDLTVSKSSNRYFLHAAYGTLTADSGTFDIVNKLIPCGSGGCSDSYDNGLNTVTVNVPAGHGVTGTLALSLSDPAGSVTCTLRDGSVVTVPPIGALDTVDPPSGYDTPSITVTKRFDKTIAPGLGVANFFFCENHGGTTPFVEIPPCPRRRPPTEKCEQDRRRNAVGDLIVTFLFSSSDPVGWGDGL